MLQAIGSFIIGNAVNVAVGTIVTVSVGTFIASKIKSFVRSKKALMVGFVRKIQDPDTRKLIEDIILETERAIGSKQGKLKQKIAIDKLVLALPAWSRSMARIAVQAFFDGLAEQGKI